jgi:hypothetical protein
MRVGNSLPHRTTLYPAEGADNIREPICLPDSDGEAASRDYLLSIQVTPENFEVLRGK